MAFRRVRALVCACAVFAALIAARPFAAPVPATVTVSGGAIALATGITSSAYYVALSQPASAGLTVTIALSGEGAPGSSVSATTLTFAPGASEATYTLTAGHNLGELTISYTLGGADAGGYTAPAPHTVAIKSPMTVSVPASMLTGLTATGHLSVGQVPIQGDLIVNLTLSGPAAAGSTVSPSVIVLSGMTGGADFSITAGSPGALTLEYTLSGSAVAKYALPLPKTITVEPHRC